MWWVGGYALGISLPPDWVGHTYLSNDAYEQFTWEPGYVTNYENILFDREAGFTASYMETLLMTETGSRSCRASRARSRSSTAKPTLPAVDISARVRPPLWGVVVAMGLVYVVWGSTYIGIRVTVETMPPLLSGGVRFFLAGLLTLAYLLLRRRHTLVLPARRELAAAAAVGVALIFGGAGLRDAGRDARPGRHRRRARLDDLDLGRALPPRRRRAPGRG